MIYEISAAGGNITVIESEPSCEDIAARGKELMALSDTAEQAGFIIGDSFTMAGSEFCVNGSRAAAIVLAEFESGEVAYHTSGFSEHVHAEVEKVSDGHFNVSASFKDLRYSMTMRTACTIVKLPGITHLVLEEPVPDDAREILAEFIEEYGLSDDPAVGLISVNGNAITPLVSVRAIDEIHEETACGSGSIAACLACGIEKVIQPTGKPIFVKSSDDSLIVTSEMEVLS